jgi:hypothetical protein
MDKVMINLSIINLFYYVVQLAAHLEKTMGLGRVYLL